MHPILFEPFGIAIPSYGVVLALTFLICLKLFSRLGSRVGLDPDVAVDLWIWVIVGAVVGAKLLLVIVEFDTYWRDPAELLRTIRTLGVFYGGLIGGAVAGLGFAYRHGLPLGSVADAAAPVVALGQALGRWGCLFAGCCYGSATDVPWAVVYSDPTAATGVPLHTPLHPTPLYASANALVIMAVLLWLLRRKSFDGQVFWTYVLLYGMTRPIIELFRGDDRGELVSQVLSPSQWIGIAMTLTAVGALVWLHRRHGRDGSSAPPAAA